MDSTIFVFNKQIDEETCKELRREFLSYTPEGKSLHLTRINATFHPIVDVIQFILEKELNIKLFCTLAAFQIRGVNQEENLHVHSPYKSDYNSVLYLNDNFIDGEFYTEEGIVHKPKIGDLIFFNGKKIKHGVKKIHGNKRMAINFWWDIL
jgi:hypothetical protein